MSTEKIDNSVIRVTRYVRVSPEYSRVNRQWQNPVVWTAMIREDFRERAGISIASSSFRLIRIESDYYGICAP